jgi:hypothetical protein
MIKFIHKFSGGKATYSTDAVTIQDILSDFTNFMRGCGFCLPDNCYLDFVSEDEPSIDEYLDDIPDDFTEEEEEEEAFDEPAPKCCSCNTKPFYDEDY